MTYSYPIYIELKTADELDDYYIGKVIIDKRLIKINEFSNSYQLLFDTIKDGVFKMIDFDWQEFVENKLIGGKLNLAFNLGSIRDIQEVSKIYIIDQWNTVKSN